MKLSKKISEGYKMTEFGEIPSEWTIVALEETKNKNDRYSFCGGPFGSDLTSKEYTSNGVQIIQLQNIVEGHFNDKYRVFTSEDKANKLKKCNIYPGEIVIAKMAEPVARACILPEKAERYLMASDAIRLSPDISKYDTRYLMYSINASYFRRQAELNSTGTTRLRIGLNSLAKLKFIMPPFKEQQKIADIISNVDQIIENTNQLAEKIKKLKKGLMQQLLTKGIGHKEFKKTELGEIPAKWQITTLSGICDFITKGSTPTTYGYEWQESGIQFFKSDVVKDGRFVYGDYKFISGEAHKQMSRSKIVSGDILITITGNIGRVAIVPNEIKEANINQHIAKISVINNLANPLFVYYWLNQKKIVDYYELIKTGLAYPQISLKQVRETIIPLPSKEEQQKIVEILLSVDEQIKSYEQEKEKYIELKKGLMQQLLTGKLRVTV